MEKQQILDMVAQYCKEHHTSKEWKPGDRINYAGRVYDEEELCNLVDASLDFWLTAGKYTEEFEAGLGKYLDIPYCSIVNSGSSANLLALAALTSPLLKEKRILPGDEVITVAAAFPTTVAPIVQCGAVPVFVDIEIPYYNIDISLLEGALSSRTKAVFLAHSLGNVFDLKAVKEFCVQHSLFLIEDNFVEKTFLATDKRRTELIHKDIYDQTGKLVAPSPVRGYFSAKYVDPDFIGERTSARPFLIRYSDIALVFAEAAGPDEGLALVNEIRRRAGIPELPEGMSLAEFRKAVIQERALELAFEGNRLYDLRRTASVTATVPEATKLSEEQAAFYPIPQRELDLNPNVK